MPDSQSATLDQVPRILTHVEPAHRGQIDPHRGRHVVYHGYTVLVTDKDGAIPDGAGLGLFDFDTRILSKLRLLVDGRPPACDASALVDHDYWAAHLSVPREPGDVRGPILPQDTIGVEIRRRVGRGMIEELIVRNHSMAPAELDLSKSPRISPTSRKRTPLRTAGGRRRLSGTRRLRPSPSSIPLATARARSTAMRIRRVAGPLPTAAQKARTMLYSPIGFEQHAADGLVRRITSASSAVSGCGFTMVAK